MLKFSLIATLLLSTSMISFADTAISKDLHPSAQLNTSIERLPLPPTPGNMKLPEFSQGIIGWGTGPDGAEKRLNNITAQDVNGFKHQGVSLEMVQTWQKFYENETLRNPGNPAAPLRAKLMKKIAELW
ncbi:DUF4951 domain-containing protein [Acinetobacter chinensis]|uniref:DUF4951 domain-containing protein n=1 Tax=Acinetobacter chinensis TaxID=2004650 RepID=A0A3B7LXU3_9GAMM|nr:DUF4951 domain-containing protein [Acinetobacter chinensis]AXY57730.1 DUF4951 domain-containing protein [Acinetobacter chinensis]